MWWRKPLPKRRALTLPTGKYGEDIVLTSTIMVEKFIIKLYGVMNHMKIRPTSTVDHCRRCDN